MNVAGTEGYSLAVEGAIRRSNAPSKRTLGPARHTRRPDSYFRYDRPMTVSKVSLSIDEDVLAEARERAGRRELSSYVTDALRRQLQHDRLGELLAEMDVSSGPIPDDLMEEARQLWQGAADAPKARRRSA